VCHCEQYVVDPCSTPHTVWMCAALGLVPSSAPGCSHVPFSFVSLGRSVARSPFSPDANSLPTYPARFLIAVLGKQSVPDVTAAAVPGHAMDETAVAVAAVFSGWCLCCKSGCCAYGTLAGVSGLGC